MMIKDERWTECLPFVLKYKFGNRHFWAEEYYVGTVGLNEATIKKYIQEQEQHDIAM